MVSTTDQAVPHVTKRRLPHLRFRLRTLLILTTLFAVWMGYHVQRAYRTEKATLLVAKLGGHAWCCDRRDLTLTDSWMGHLNQWYRKALATVFGDGCVRDMTAIELSGTAVTIDHLRQLKGLTHLKWLSLSETSISDLALTHVEDMKKLEWLDLSYTKVTAKGVPHLERLSELQWLNIQGTAVASDRDATLQIATSVYVPMPAALTATLGPSRQTHTVDHRQPRRTLATFKWSELKMTFVGPPQGPSGLWNVRDYETVGMQD